MFGRGREGKRPGCGRHVIIAKEKRLLVGGEEAEREKRGGRGGDKKREREGRGTREESRRRAGGVGSALYSPREEVGSEREGRPTDRPTEGEERERAEKEDTFVFPFKRCSLDPQTASWWWRPSFCSRL